MKKKVIVLSLCALLITGCGNKTVELKEGEEVITSLKDGKNISVKDLYNELKESYGLEKLMN